jgi:hypothetical protein
MIVAPPVLDAIPYGELLPNPSAAYDEVMIDTVAMGGARVLFVAGVSDSLAPAVAKLAGT